MAFPSTAVTYSFETPYTTPGPIQTATVPQGAQYQTSFGNPSLNKPLPMGIIVTKDSTNYPASVLYTIDMAVVDDQQAAEMIFDILITQPDGDFVATVSDLGSGFCSVQVSKFIPGGELGNSFTFVVQFNTNLPSIFLPGSFDNTDNYALINVPASNNNPLDASLIVEFTRDLQAVSNTKVESVIPAPSMSMMSLSPQVASSTNDVTTLIRIPNVIILGQTTFLYGDNLSDYTFIVYDDCCYNDHRHAEINCHDCDTNNMMTQEKAKKTTFFQFQPPLIDVVKGKGKTLRQKVLSIYNKYQPQTGPTFQGFYNTLISYGMLKYFLGRLLYGKFDIQVLCKNNNKSFMKDLKHSRFCYYVDYLLDPENGFIGFERYFITCC